MDTNGPAAVMGPQEAVGRAGHSLCTLIDWTTNKTLPVTILPATKDEKLSSGRTYLIVGSSDIARVICEWVIESGAKYIVVASRHPDHTEARPHGLGAKGAFSPQNLGIAMGRPSF
ncbi:uncharacterized protein M421DRAFT_93596 [Didymella exigua CBS 183.55]|uniref:Uncharacterized protein n=1 Tax=Didymella exigua CBS 183.55 TaxID=1150837 RepID=A0A6A5RND1_9PLEO|nr:uncharacterized protein M421DRAFT_93596 [Didymella exigua CBS 183.55]KAF1927027.1 hypothetical protein M421DRAFT_93596 [Didymella exigua CBS 183.55]